MISFAGGLPAPELFPVTEIQQATEEVLGRRAGRALQYGETEGLGDLRDWIAGCLAQRGLDCTRSNILITTGAQQGLDLLGRVLLDPDDLVLVENPTYMAALSAWRPLGVRYAGLRSDQSGILGDAIESLPGFGAKMMYCIPNFQNPQGTTLALDRRIALVERLRGQPTILVEDDPYAELRFEGEPLPTLLELHARGGPASGSDGQVVYLGTVSKVLSPGLRVGWVVGHPLLIEKLTLAKQAADLHTSTFCQEIVLELAKTGTIERHVPVLRRAYHERCQAMLSALERHFPNGATWTRPKGGMFLLVKLPEGFNASELLKRALEVKTAFVPGEEFHLDGEGRNTLRLNFSYAAPEKIAIGIERLSRAL
jgi:2-aminoadipate transaminase